MAELRQPPSIDAHGPAGFTIGGDAIQGSALILNDLASAWGPTTLAEVTPADFERVMASRAEVEFVLLGCGPRMAPTPRVLREAFHAARLGLEVMDTPAACRLYNMLARDGRRLAAALLPA